MEWGLHEKGAQIACAFARYHAILLHCTVPLCGSGHQRIDEQCVRCRWIRLASTCDVFEVTDDPLTMLAKAVAAFEQLLSVRQR